MLRMVSYPHRPKSGHITCYLNRTYHVLTTLPVLDLDKPSAAWYRHGVSGGDLMRHITTLLGLLIVFTAANVGAQAKPVCSLLTAGDVSEIGATGQGIPGEMPTSQGPTKGETMKMCSWRMQDGGLHVSVAKVPAGMSRDVVLAELNKSYDVLKSQGWTEEKKDFGNVTCILVMPPTGKKDDPANTSCLALAKGMMVSAATITKTRVPMEKLKTLVDSASARL
jgi:hypothetical protein